MWDWGEYLFWECYYYLYDCCEDYYYDNWVYQPGRVKFETICFWIGIGIIVYWSYIGVQPTETPEYELSYMNTFYLEQDFDFWEEQGYEIVFEEPAPEDCVYKTQFFFDPEDCVHITQFFLEL